MQGRGQPVEDYRGSNCEDMRDSVVALYMCMCKLCCIQRWHTKGNMMFQR